MRTLNSHTAIPWFFLSKSHTPTCLNLLIFPHFHSWKTGGILIHLHFFRQQKNSCLKGTIEDVNVLAWEPIVSLIYGHLQTLDFRFFYFQSLQLDCVDFWICPVPGHFLFHLLWYYNFSVHSFGFSLEPYTYKLFPFSGSQATIRWEKFMWSSFPLPCFSSFYLFLFPRLYYF